MKKVCILLAAGALAVLIPGPAAYSDQGQGDGDSSSTCVVDSEGGMTCPEPEPYEPTPCELAMNDIWAAAQVEIDALLLDPICADFASRPDGGAGVAESGAMDLTFRTGNSRLVLVKKRTLKKLRRRARRCGS